MNNVSEILQRGIKARESGSVEEAIALFKKTLKIEGDVRTRVDILNHLGLAYWHYNDLEKARGTWKMALSISEESKNQDGIAVSLRNLSGKNLWTTTEELRIALHSAHEAYLIAECLGRKDLVWFIHGVFAANHALGDREYIRIIVKNERKELRKVWRQTPKLTRRVWLSGLIMDYFVAYGKVTVPFLRISKVIARMFKLKRREEQIDKLLVSV